MDRDFDVVVVGSGGAGNSAAIMACDAGLNVLMLEAGSRIGGSTVLSGGVFMAGGTSVQRAAGIEDSTDSFYEFYMTANRWQLEPALVRAYCEGAGEFIEWAISLGVEYLPEQLYNSSIASVARGHVPTGYGARFLEVLHGAATTRGTQVVTHTRVERLLVEGGRVVGVHADGQDIRAAAVILACGGLGGADKALLAEYYPDAIRHGDRHGHIGPDTNRGDAIPLGLGAGAVVARSTINRGLVSLAPDFDMNEAEGFLPAWLVFVNREGRRFMDEDAPYAVSGDIVNLQTDAVCFAIFDQEMFLNANGKGHFDTGMVGTECPSWEHAMFEKNLAKGRIQTADTLEALGAKIGVHPQALRNNIDRYNGFVEQGHDAQFFKKMRGTVKVERGPFYATEVRAVTVPMSSVGLQVDARAQVHDGADAPIPGLYAAGEAMGGVVGYYLGGGNGIGPPAVFGRIAGRSAADYVRARDAVTTDAMESA
ncbi:hypothetical protein BH10PSE12_BH10PSE12_13340 [soil metagenome]